MSDILLILLILLFLTGWSHSDAASCVACWFIIRWFW